MPDRALAIVNEALALRASHPHAPAADVLDLAMQGHEVWLEDLLVHMVPPSPFALLVAEAVGDLSPACEWRALTGPNADEKVREAMRQSYIECVLPKFVKRYCWSPPQAHQESRAALGELLRAKLVKDPALAGKQRRLLEKHGTAPVDQRRMREGVAAKLWPERGGSDNP